MTSTASARRNEASTREPARATTTPSAGKNDSQVHPRAWNATRRIRAIASSTSSHRDRSGGASGSTAAAAVDEAALLSLVASIAALLALGLAGGTATGPGISARNAPSRCIRCQRTRPPVTAESSERTSTAYIRGR